MQVHDGRAEQVYLAGLLVLRHIGRDLVLDSIRAPDGLGRRRVLAALVKLAGVLARLRVDGQMLESKMPGFLLDRRRAS